MRYDMYVIPEGSLDAFVVPVVDEGVSAGGVHADARHVPVGREMGDHFFPVDCHVHLKQVHASADHNNIYNIKPTPR